jgi:hypothetical protein
MNNFLNFGFNNLPILISAETHSISAENPTGEKGGGAREIPTEDNPAYKLGKGWKVRPCITLPKNSKTTLAEIKGPGNITHIWITVDTKAYRTCILRFFWDGENFPSVEVPLGDFFANGDGLRYNVNSLPIVVNPAGGFNCYFPMPFKKNCRVEIENEGFEDIPGFFYQISYTLGEIPENIGYFHSQWRRSITNEKNPEHIIVDNINGCGHYVGTFISWTQLSNGWWGEGEIKFFIDGDVEYPTICGTGTEDYFGGAWGFGNQNYSTPFLGYPFCRKEPGEVPKHYLYRWHILDPIRFQKNLKVTIQTLGWSPDGKLKPLSEDISSVAYWYQKEPHSEFPPILKVEKRLPR